MAEHVPYKDPEGEQPWTIHLNLQPQSESDFSATRELLQRVQALRDAGRTEEADALAAEFRFPLGGSESNR